MAPSDVVLFWGVRYDKNVVDKCEFWVVMGALCLEICPGGLFGVLSNVVAVRGHRASQICRLEGPVVDRPPSVSRIYFCLPKSEARYTYK